MIKDLLCPSCQTTLTEGLLSLDFCPFCRFEFEGEIKGDASNTELITDIDAFLEKELGASPELSYESVEPSMASFSEEVESDDKTQEEGDTLSQNTHFHDISEIKDEQDLEAWMESEINKVLPELTQDSSTVLEDEKESSLHEEDTEVIRDQEKEDNTFSAEPLLSSDLENRIKELEEIQPTSLLSGNANRFRPPLFTESKVTSDVSSVLSAKPDTSNKTETDEDSLKANEASEVRESLSQDVLEDSIPPSKIEKIAVVAYLKKKLSNKSENGEEKTPSLKAKVEKAAVVLNEAIPRGRHIKRNDKDEEVFSEETNISKPLKNDLCSSDVIEKAKKEKFIKETAKNLSGKEEATSEEKDEGISVSEKTLEEAKNEKFKKEAANSLSHKEDAANEEKDEGVSVSEEILEKDYQQLSYSESSGELVSEVKDENNALKELVLKKSTEDYKNTSKGEEVSKVKPQKEDNRNRITTASEKINRGKDKDSMFYIRGVLNGSPFKFQLGAFWTIVAWAGCPLIIGGIAWIIFLSKLPEDTKKWMGVVGLLLFPLLVIAYIVSIQKSKCVVCGSKQFVPRNNRKHVKAAKFPGLGTLIPTAFHALFLKWFRCRDCGTSNRLKD